MVIDIVGFRFAFWTETLIGHVARIDSWQLHHRQFFFSRTNKQNKNETKSLIFLTQIDCFVGAVVSWIEQTLTELVARRRGRFLVRSDGHCDAGLRRETNQRRMLPASRPL